MGAWSYPARGALLRKDLVGRAQWETHPGHPRKRTGASLEGPSYGCLLDDLFEHPAGSFSSCPTSLARRGLREAVLAQCARPNKEMGRMRTPTRTLACAVQTLPVWSGFRIGARDERYCGNNTKYNTQFSIINIRIYNS